MNEKQFIKTGEDSTRYFSDEAMTVHHREDGPAVEYSDGDKDWYINGKRHREDGPAIEYTNGYKAWYINNKLHREDGPAVVHTNGYKDLYYIHGRRVNEDGTLFCG